MTRPDKRPGTLFGGRFPHSHRRVRKNPASTTTSAASTPRTASNVKGIGITHLLLETRPSCSPRTFIPFGIVSTIVLEFWPMRVPPVAHGRWQDITHRAGGGQAEGPRGGAPDAAQGVCTLNGDDKSAMNPSW